MQKIIAILILLLFQSQVWAQGEKSLSGKWKIITFDAVVFHDYRNDSTYFPPEFLATLKGSDDSLFMVGFLKGMIKAFDNYVYEFADSSEYREIKEGKLKQKGTYQLVPEEKKLVLNAKDKFGGETKQTLVYEIIDQFLLLNIPTEEQNLKFKLEKVE